MSGYTALTDWRRFVNFLFRRDTREVKVWLERLHLRVETTHERGSPFCLHFEIRIKDGNAVKRDPQFFFFFFSPLRTTRRLFLTFPNRFPRKLGKMRLPFPPPHFPLLLSVEHDICWSSAMACCLIKDSRFARCMKIKGSRAEKVEEIRDWYLFSLREFRSLCLKRYLFFS